MPWTDACAVDGPSCCADGRRRHEHVHLVDGLVVDFENERRHHNGPFDHRTVQAGRALVCIDLRSHPTRLQGRRQSVNRP